MEGGFPMLNCLLQHTLRCLCTPNPDTSASSKWLYAVYWRILPRNYPPPKWDYGGGALDRAKGNKRNWILVWEDGFCDFFECQRAGSSDTRGRFGADVFFKMSHEVYSYGEGLIGKVAADNSHKWVYKYKDGQTESEPSFISSWNVSNIDPQPRAWQFQFHSGIQTIALISVREGIIQLGSFDKIVEDLSLVISIQRKFIYLQSIPGIYAMQRPYVPIQHPHNFKPNNTLMGTNELLFEADDKRQLAGKKSEKPDESPPIKALSLGYNKSKRNNGPQSIWSVPPLSPSTTPCSLGALLSKTPFLVPCCRAIEAVDTPPLPLIMANNNNNIRSSGQSGKEENFGGLGQRQTDDINHSGAIRGSAPEEEKPSTLNPHSGLAFGPPRQGRPRVL